VDSVGGVVRHGKGERRGRGTRAEDASVRAEQRHLGRTLATRLRRLATPNAGGRRRSRAFGEGCRAICRKLRSASTARAYALPPLRSAAERVFSESTARTDVRARYHSNGA